MPVSATVLAGPDRLQVTFDQPLQPGTVAGGNWGMLHAGFIWGDTGPGTAAGSTVTVPMAQALPVAGETCDYSPPPFDVLGLAGGLPAASFAGLPIT